MLSIVVLPTNAPCDRIMSDTSVSESPTKSNAEMEHSLLLNRLEAAEKSIQIIKTRAREEIEIQRIEIESQGKENEALRAKVKAEMDENDRPGLYGSRSTPVAPFLSKLKQESMEFWKSEAERASKELPKQLAGDINEENEASTRNLIKKLTYVYVKIVDEMMDDVEGQMTIMSIKVNALTAL